MITTKKGIKFSLNLNDKKIKITSEIKKYFEECEKKIAEELDKIDFPMAAHWQAWYEDGEFKCRPIFENQFYK